MRGSFDTINEKCLKQEDFQLYNNLLSKKYLYMVFISRIMIIYDFYQLEQFDVD